MYAWLIGRFVGCDFRKAGSGGNPLINGPMMYLDYGERVSFSGCTFSGINSSSPDSSNLAFSLSNTLNGKAMARMAVSGCTFVSFHTVFGASLNCELVVSGNTYNAISGSILLDDNLDSSISLRDGVVALSATKCSPTRHHKQWDLRFLPDIIYSAGPLRFCSPRQLPQTT